MKQHAESPTKQRLLDAAAELVSGSPNQDVPIRAICERAGVQLPTLYHYFGSKDGLMDALVSFAFESYLNAKSDQPRLADPIEVLRRGWDNLSVVSYTQPAASYSLSPDNELKAEVVLNLGDLKPEDIGVEMLFTTSDRKGRLHLNSLFEFSLVDFNDGVATFQASILPEVTGLYQVATRVYPKHVGLPHRQDFPLVKWL